MYGERIKSCQIDNREILVFCYIFLQNGLMLHKKRSKRFLMKFTKILFLTVVVFLSETVAFSAIKMSSIFSDNMMFQRDMPIKVWGSVSAGAKVEVEFGGIKKSAKVNDNGDWSVVLEKMLANKVPQEMVVFENGKVGKRIKNILVGEVWILGGQSNMGFKVSKTIGAEKTISKANYPEIRYFGQNTWALSKTPRKTAPTGVWKVVTPENVGDMSAVGVLFAEDLQRNLDVPVGLVFTALGAAQMIAYIPEDKVRDLSYTRDVYDDFIKRNATYSYERAKKAWDRDVEKWKKECEKARAENRKEPRKSGFAPNTVSFHPPFCTPSYVYNAVISPIEGFSVRGVLWYQGESDSADKRLENFVEQFDLLTSAWREKFGNPTMPFLCVQLASFDIKNRDWAETRWKQYLCTKSIKNNYMVSIIDTGEKDDIHPRDKTLVGERLAKLALYEIYEKKDIVPYGPIFKDAKYEGDKVTISFELNGKKLATKEAPRGFEVQIDGKWCIAKPELKGDKVIVRAADKSLKGEIEGVRYLWKNWAMPDVWLFDSQYLPAIPFIDKN